MQAANPLALCRCCRYPDRVITSGLLTIRELYSGSNRNANAATSTGNLLHARVGEALARVTPIFGKVGASPAFECVWSHIKR